MGMDVKVERDAEVDMVNVARCIMRTGSSAPVPLVMRLNKSEIDVEAGSNEL